MSIVTSMIGLRSSLVGVVLCFAGLGSADLRVQAQVSTFDGVDYVQTGGDLVPPPIWMVRPKARSTYLPATRWVHQPNHALWNRAAMSALKTHGKPLVSMVPDDIQDWCPLYPVATEMQRRAFWVGFMSSLAKYESTYRPDAVGAAGGGTGCCKSCQPRRADTGAMPAAVRRSRRVRRTSAVQCGSWR